MRAPAPTYGKWRKGSRSNGDSDCVEVAIAVDAEVIGVRDSKQIEQGPFDLEPADFVALLNTATR